MPLKVVAEYVSRLPPVHLEVSSVLVMLGCDLSKRREHLGKSSEEEQRGAGAEEIARTQKLTLPFLSRSSAPSSHTSRPSSPAPQPPNPTTSTFKSSASRSRAAL